MKSEINFLETAMVRKWGGDINDPNSMSYYSYSAKIRGDVGQFSLVQLYQLKNGVYLGDMGANTTGVSLTMSQLMEIAALQVEDECTIDQKMNWLLYYGEGNWGAPLAGGWNHAIGETWRDAVNIKQISAVYAGQPVTITGHRIFNDVLWQGKKIPSVPMSRIKKGTLQKVTVVDRADRYGERPKGVIWLPVNFKGDEAWIFDCWLE